MKRVKKLLLVAVLSFALFTTNVFAKDKVKVYVFEAGGCPYCEAEIEYLKKLDSYKEKFEIVQKELYVDHIEWKEGKDYDLGVKVAEAFLNKGYQNASYQGTPFVVIGNRYAAAAYSESLESVINEAYENEDKDIVKCFIDDDDNCSDKIAEYKAETTTQSPSGDPEPTQEPTEDKKKDEKDSNSITAVIVLIVIVAAVLVLLLLARGKNKNVDETEVEEETKAEKKVVEEKVVEEKVETKKTVKKAPAKKTATKKTTKKAPAKKTATKKTTKK